VPEPAPIDPQSKIDFWQRHRYYLLDPDLRAARQQHPFFAIWDNHDIFKGNETDLLRSTQAFFDYLPIRRPDGNNPKRIYRSLRYGNLADIYLMDIETLINQDLIEGNNLLSNEQYNWITDELSDSMAKWRILGNQKFFTQWSTAHITFPLPLGDGTVAVSSARDGFPAERLRLLNFIKDQELENNIFFSGDIHLSIVSDISLDPTDPAQYDPETGEGSIGVEFIPGSITRGNTDELIGTNPISGSLDFILEISNFGNPHHRFLEIIQHGYGLLDISSEQTKAQLIFSKKLQIVKTDNIWKKLPIRDGKNHWARDVDTNTSKILSEDLSDYKIKFIHPNPTTQNCSIDLYVKKSQKVDFQIVSQTGKIYEINNLVQNELIKDQLYTIQLNLETFTSGVYFIKILGKHFQTHQKIIKI